MPSEIERAPVRMVRTKAGLAPAAPIDLERLEQIGFGKSVDVVIKQNRSMANHRHFFAFLGHLVNSCAVPYQSTEAFLDALKLSCDVIQQRVSLDGEVFIIPGSISFAARDEPAFNDFKQRALILIAERYGVTPEDMP
jgi:hypothetical protein